MVVFHFITFHKITDQFIKWSYLFLFEKNSDVHKCIRKCSILTCRTKLTKLFVEYVFGYFCFALGTTSALAGQILKYNGCVFISLDFIWKITSVKKHNYEINVFICQQFVINQIVIIISLSVIKMLLLRFWRIIIVIEMATQHSCPKSRLPRYETIFILQ